MKLVLRTAAVTVLAAGLAAVAVQTATAASPSGPPDGVWTCEWIAAHPVDAARAQVSCVTPVSSMALVTPTVLSSPQPASAASSAAVAAQGCEQIPLDGTRVGRGVFAWGQYWNATHWGFGAQWSPPVDYTWYVQRIDGVNVMNGYVTSLGWYTTPNVGLTAYRWGAQNHGSLPQSWQECFYQ